MNDESETVGVEEGGERREAGKSNVSVSLGL